jgi:hypothetical protein
MGWAIFVSAAFNYPTLDNKFEERKKMPTSVIMLTENMNMNI